uniref:Uncharacterized protein n=1 Tax=Panagrolaimus sp. PS1159 TaxID=55785 RepID=A0AC35F3N6_9BILA
MLLIYHYLFIFPVFLEYEPFWSSLPGRSYYAKNNIIFVFAGSRENSDFALVFREATNCQNVYDIIFPEKPVIINEKTGKPKKKKPIMPNLLKELDRRFLQHLCKAIRKETDLKLLHIFQDWLEQFSDKTKEHYVELAKEEEVYFILYPNEVEQAHSSRKKKLSDSKDDSDAETSVDGKKSKHTSKENQKDRKKSVSFEKQSADENDSKSETYDRKKLRKSKSSKDVPRDPKRTSSGNKDNSADGKKSNSCSNKDRVGDGERQRPRRRTSCEEDSGDENSVVEIKPKPQSNEDQKSDTQRPRKPKRSDNSDAENKPKHRSNEVQNGGEQRPRKRKQSDDKDNSAAKKLVGQTRTGKNIKQQPRKRNHSDSGNDSESFLVSKEPKSPKNRSPKLVKRRMSQPSDDDDSGSQSSVDDRRHYEAPLVPAKKQKLSINDDLIPEDDNVPASINEVLLTKLTSICKNDKLITQEAESEHEDNESNGESQAQVLSGEDTDLNLPNFSSASTTPSSSYSKSSSSKTALLQTSTLTNVTIEGEGYELRENKLTGTVNGTLIVFFPHSAKNRWYEYHLNETEDDYVCCNCSDVIATRRVKDNGEICFDLGPNKHKCKTKF